MNATSKKTLKAAALAAVLSAVLPLTGCVTQLTHVVDVLEKAPGSHHTVEAPSVR